MIDQYSRAIRPSVAAREIAHGPSAEVAEGRFNARAKAIQTAINRNARPL